MDCETGKASKFENLGNQLDSIRDESKGIPKPAPNVRIDYYQTESDVVVNFFIKNQKQEDVIVEFREESFRVISNKMTDNSVYSKEVHLAKKISPISCAYKVLSTKIEIRLRKQDGNPWPALEAQNDTKEFRPQYPSSSKNKRDWDKMEKEMEKEDLDADSNVFSKLFEAGDENMQKAMMKSMESGGTVLSTNWDEVGKGKVEISPPDGMEFKKWD